VSHTERVDRAIYLGQHRYGELLDVLLAADADAFTGLFPDYPAWRSARAAIRPREHADNTMIELTVTSLRAMVARRRIGARRGE